MENNHRNKPRKRINEYIIVKPTKIYSELKEAIKSLPTGFVIAKLVKRYARVCSKCGYQTEKNSFSFCPHCGTKY